MKLLRLEGSHERDTEREQKYNVSPWFKVEHHLEYISIDFQTSDAGKESPPLTPPTLEEKLSLQ